MLTRASTLSAVEDDVGTAVLGHPPLGDVQAGDDLEPADDGQGARRAAPSMTSREHAVDAVADPEPCVLRLDVHVAGPRVERRRRGSS